MKNKKLILTAIIVVAIILFMQVPTLAYQSTSKGNPVSTKVNYSSTSGIGWALGIRQMEASGAGLGLNESTLNTTTLLSGESNNIDIHLQKNTEYGAMVILGASNYGKQGDLTKNSTSRYMHLGERKLTGTSKKASSTGNVYGVYELGYANINSTTGVADEWVAGGGSNFISTSINARYVNRYTKTNKQGLPGDATIDGTIDLGEWHNSISTAWISSNNGTDGFSRSSSNAVFDRNTTISNDYCARAVIVNGIGF